MKNEGICTAIAFYDLEKQIDFRGLFSFFEQWCLNKGYTPLRGSADGEDIKTTQTWTFKYTKRFLEKRNFENITGFWFGTYPSQWGCDALDAIFSVHISLRSKGIFDLYFHNDILLFERGYIENLVANISKYLKAYYGIVYQRDFNMGPGLYANGIITGLDRNSSSLEIQRQRDNIGEWWRRYFVNPERYTLGQLRDIYPINLLSEVHLSQPVFNTILKEWIVSSADHGELKPLTEILWEWWIPEDKILVVREALLQTGLLICA